MKEETFYDDFLSTKLRHKSNIAMNGSDKLESF